MTSSALNSSSSASSTTVALFAVFLCYSSFFLLLVSSSEPVVSVEEKNVLLEFTKNFKHAPKSEYLWDSNKPVCDPKSEDNNWKGVGCMDFDDKKIVTDLSVPGAIAGEIKKETIGKLASLRVLTLRENQLNSPLPDDLSNLKQLTHLHLNNNNFSEIVPEYISNFVLLTHLILNDNNFSGAIPEDFSKLVNLNYLHLENNNFSGTIPEYFANMNLVEFNVSNNNFSGRISNELFKKFGESAFVGNKHLCGDPLPNPCKGNVASPPPHHPAAESQALKTPPPPPDNKDVIVGVSVGSGLLLLMLLCCLGKKKINKLQPLPQSPLADVARGERKRLVFLEARGIYGFDMEDLYRASQVVLGEGGSTIGMSLKMMIDQGKIVVIVKRLKKVVVTRNEFESKMEVLGKMKSKYVVPLIAYYYSEDKKLLVYAYMSAGSLSDRLHGKQDFGRTSFNWDHRMRIALDAARGVKYLHEANVVHGNIKSSNILLQQETNEHVASASDYGLVTLFDKLISKNNYQAPEVNKPQDVTFESDVYSFGVLLLELLTGKDPNQTSLVNEGTEFPMWVKSIIHGKPNAEVFDVELRSHQNTEEKMVQLLQIAKDCVLWEPKRRPEMWKVVSMMEDMNKDRLGDWVRQSSDDHSTFEGTPSTETRDTPSTITP